ncbi:hypothetical protein JCM17960_04560 [Magnetospira thiophila]
MLVLLVAFIATVAAPSSAWAQETVIGVVKLVKGRVDAARAAGVQLLKKEDPIYKGDTLQTGIGGKLGVVFNDGSTFNMDENSMMVIDEMVYDPDQGTGRIALNAVRGLFAFASGAITRNTAEGMTIRTPVLSIGIRGTIKNLQAAPVGETNTAAAQTGSARVYNTSDSKVINAGQKAQTTSPTQPITVSAITPTDQRQFQGVQEGNREMEQFGETGQIEGFLKQQLQGTPEGASLERVLAERDAILGADPAQPAAITDMIGRAETALGNLENSAVIKDLIGQNPAVESYISGLRAFLTGTANLLLPLGDTSVTPPKLPPFRADGQSSALLYDMRNISGYNPTSLDPTGIVPSDAGVELPFCVSYSGSAGNYYWLINSDGTLAAGASGTGNHTFGCFDYSGSSPYCSCSNNCTFTQTYNNGSVVSGTLVTSYGTFMGSGQQISGRGCITEWEKVN